MENILTDTPKQNYQKITGYRFIDIEILSDVEILCCPECKRDGLKLHENVSKERILFTPAVKM